LVTGMAILQLVAASANAMPNSISGGIASGTLEALFATPTPLPQLLAGMSGFGILWAAARATLLVVAFAVVGGGLSLSHVPLAIVIAVLLVLAHLPIGIVAASM